MNYLQVEGGDQGYMSNPRETARFSPDPAPREPEELPSYLGDVFETLGSMVNSPTRNFAPMNSAPPKPTTGDIAFADGIAWDPGSGRGLYYFDTGAWVKI